MSCAKWPLFMACFSTFIYTISVLFMLTGLCGLHIIDEDSLKEEWTGADPDAVRDFLKPVDHIEVSHILTFAVELGMLITSILLIVGVKKQLPKLMAPWICMALVAVLSYWLILLFDYEDTVLAYFFAIFYIAAIWYPIYRHYKSVRDSTGKQSQAKACVEKGIVQSTTFSGQPATAPIEV